MSKKDKRGKEDAHDGREFIALCKTLSTPVAYNTLLALLEGPKSVADISLENKTPLSSTYKTIKGLQQIGLVSVQDIIIDEQGKRVTLYKSKVKSFSINFDKDGAEITYQGLNSTDEGSPGKISEEILSL
jgi:predicted transcriptional regulator